MSSEAVETAQTLIVRGHSIDMGIGQINSRTAPRLGLSVADAFDACLNMTAASALMERSYRSVARAGSGQRSLAAMLSIYNTGNAWRGFGNGYVGRVYRAAATIVPLLGRTVRLDVDPGSIDPAGNDSISARSAVPTPQPLQTIARLTPAPP